LLTATGSKEQPLSSRPSVAGASTRQHRTRVDIAKELTRSFTAPVHLAFANHDYVVPQVSRETSHELFRRKLSTKPYHAAAYKGCKFVCLNNCLGGTWNAGHPSYKKGIGSFGEEQWNWLEAELPQHKPTLFCTSSRLRPGRALQRERLPDHRGRFEAR
jgi:hypothetical protein